MPVWSEGIGETLGDELVTQGPLFTSGTVRFVHYGNGDDANAGTDPEAPLKTLQAAVTASSARDMIVLKDGHDETITAVVTVALAGLVIVGAGSSSGVPTAELTLNNAANASLLSITAVGVQLRNIKFNGNAQANTAGRVSLAAAGTLISGCYFECDQYDDNAAVVFTTTPDYTVIEDSTFISVATSLANQPFGGVRVTSACTGVRLNGVVFDGGTYGFSSSALLATAAAVTNLRGENISLLRGADASLGTSTGYFMPTTVTGAGRVTWAV